MKRRVLLGAVLHLPPGSHRAAAAGAWARHLAALELGDHDVTCCFVIDGGYDGAELDSIPGCVGEVAAFMDRPGFGLHLIRLATLTNVPGYRDPHMPEARGDRRVGDTVYRHMAYVRNLLRERALHERADFLLSVDGDVLVPPGLLVDLVAQDRPICAALVCNEPDGPTAKSPQERYAWNVLDFLADRTRAHHLGQQTDFRLGGPCDVTGACCLYSYDALKKAKWAPDPAGEDIGFCRIARGAGFRAWYRPTVCPHMMTPGMLEAHRASCSTCGG